jgi:serine/arginine repetitive matrix protein 2
MSLEDVENGVISSTSSVVSLNLQCAHDATAEHKEQWLKALRSCALYTLRSLSFPTHSGRYLAHGPSVDLEADTKHSVVAILASGLPFPKSPSIHIEEASQGQVLDDQALEREERGWWALRFQQVMREMQRHKE